MTDFTGKILAEGQVPNSKTTAYTVPANTVAYVSQISFFNTGSNEETVVVYLNPSGTSRVWKRFILSENESAECFDEGSRMLLEAGDLIEIMTTNATVVDYIITGVEEA
jgi:hypothetical protein